MRIADEDMLRKLAIKQKQREKKDIEPLTEEDSFYNEEESFLSDEELEFVYSKAEEEIKTLKNITNQYKNILKESFYGDLIFEEGFPNIFFNTIDKLFDKMFPAILQGNYDIIKDELDDNISEEDFEILRYDTYIKLKRKYIYNKED